MQISCSVFILSTFFSPLNFYPDLILEFFPDFFSRLSSQLLSQLYSRLFLYFFPIFSTAQSQGSLLRRSA